MVEPKSLWALGQKEFPELEWLIPNVLPREGVALIASPPKIGKSTLLLNILVDAARGNKMLSTLPLKRRFNTYCLDLENSERRLQDRVKDILDSGEEFPTNFDFDVAFPPIGFGFCERMDQYFTEHDLVDVLVIDTLGCILPPDSSGSYSYKRDRDTIEAIRKISLSHNVLTIIVHHTRKSASEDWVGEVSGTFGIAGTVDTLMLLQRSRGTHDCVLHVTGRDVSEDSYSLSFRGGRFIWNGKLDQSDWVALSQERQEILDILRLANEPMKPNEVAGILRKNPGSVRVLMANMFRDEQLLKESYGKYVIRHS